MDGWGRGRDGVEKGWVGGEGVVMGWMGGAWAGWKRGRWMGRAEHTVGFIGARGGRDGVGTG